MKAGDHLAEKKPGVDGRTGKDVFGNDILVEPMADVTLKCGPGAELTENGLIARSVHDGQPMLTFDGRICVNKCIRITGDVDFKTGHIEFDGNVFVNGAVQEGFRVCCVNLTAMEIMGGEIDARGNVSVSAGILNATINSQGSVTATFIKNAYVSAYDNVMVSKEILDSRVFCSGICQVQSGSILTSLIAARKGIFAFDIGNGISKPSRLKIGRDDHIAAQLKMLDAGIHAWNEKLATFREQVETASERLKTLHNMVAEMAHEQDRIIREKEALEATLARFAKKRVRRNLDHAQTQLETFRKKIAETDETVNALFYEQERVENEIETLQNNIASVKEKRTELEGKKKDILQWAEADTSRPVIKVPGALFEGTDIAGPNSRLVLRDTFHNVQVREVRTDGWGGADSASIQIMQNR